MMMKSVFWWRKPEYPEAKIQCSGTIHKDSYPSYCVNKFTQVSLYKNSKRSKKKGDYLKKNPFKADGNLDL